MKVIRLGELMSRSATNPNEQNSDRIVDENDSASKLRAMFAIVPRGLSGTKLHYHTERESLILVLSGEGKEIVDGREYPLKANDLIFIRPNERHKIQNVGTTELKYLEISSFPSDSIVVE